ncbi:MAG: TonB-dependent receptor family protein [Bacteroidales bacterium]|nr:TonB-dependent receptor family protein [Bacteroidales bacterium]
MLFVAVRDSITHKGIPYASAYLVAEKDTVIYRFEVTDTSGVVFFDDIVPGYYNVHVELLGYRPFKKMMNLNGSASLPVLLAENPESLDAAKVTAYDGGFKVVGDTLVYNASVYRVRENAMLIELVRKLPGARIDKDGNVFINDKLVQDVTIGGKTFFFDDPQVAFHNIPAKILQKIKVFDTNSDYFAEADDAKDKTVMDLELKEEYKKGWFGNIGLAAGATAMNDGNKARFGKHRSSRASDDVLAGGDIDIDDVLYGARATVAAYNKKDQVTMIARTQNAMDPADYVGGTMSEDKAGSFRNTEVGVNYNTDRFKGWSPNISIKYNGGEEDSQSESNKVAFQAEGSEIVTDGKDVSHYDSKDLSAQMSLSSGRKKTQGFHLYGTFRYMEDNSLSDSKSAYSIGDELGNFSRSYSASNSKKAASSLKLNYNWNPFPKVRPKALVSVEAQAGYTDSDGDRTSYSMIAYNVGTGNNSGSGNGSGNGSGSGSSGTKETLDLMYDTDAHDFNSQVRVRYSDRLAPFTSWSLTMFGSYSDSGKDDTAYDQASKGVRGDYNDYYSLFQSNKKTVFRQILKLKSYLGAGKAKSLLDLSHYPKLDLGMILYEQKNVNYTKQHGSESTTGKDEWILNWAPNVDFLFKIDKLSVRMDYEGKSKMPSYILQSSVLDVSNPLSISTGNVYLKPSFDHGGKVSFSYIMPHKPLVSLTLRGSLTTNPLVYASWYDDKGISYSIPVNSDKAQKSVSGKFFFNHRVRMRSFMLTLMMSYESNYTVNSTYQAKSTLAGLDKENFDYASMMASFWGDADGSEFYSGNSGFSTSTRRNMVNSSSAGIMAFFGDLSLYESFSASNNRSKYSLVSTANVNTWTFVNTVNLEYQLESGFMFKTDISSYFYKGFSSVYKPYSLWNASIVKDFKKFSLTFGMSDILDKRHSQSHIVTDTYVKDVYTNSVGRYIMAGISFNFGKANAKNNDKASNAEKIFTNLGKKEG